VDARDSLADAKRELAKGIDPIASKKTTSNQVQNSVELIAREWLAKNDMWSEMHRKQVVKTMEQDAFPKIGNKSITEITTPELLAVIRVVEDRDALDVASRILQRCSSIFRYAIQTGGVDNVHRRRCEKALKR
jgi:integrase